MRGGGRRPAPDIDPAARAARYRRRRRNTLLVLVAVVVLGVVFGGRAVLLRSSWFRVTQVAVSVPAGMDPATVRAAAGVRLGSPLLSVDVSTVRGAVAAVPPVASVTVSRSWPHTVEVSVTERTPVAVTASATGPWLVDATGLAYQPAPTPVPALPTLVVDRVAPADPATRAALGVLASLTAPVREKVQVIEADGPNAVALRLADSKRVLWGSPEESARKAQVLQAMLTQSGSFYDVSAPDLPTLRR